MEENKKNDALQETSELNDVQMNEDDKNEAGQIAPTDKSTNKKTLKIALIVIGVLLVGGICYFVFNKYQAEQEARRIDIIIDTEISEVAYGTDLMDLVTVNKADKVAAKLTDAEGNEVSEPKANTEYTMVVTAVASDNTEEFKHTVMFIDDTAPVIKGVEDYKEIAFGSEFDVLNGVSATDDVDGDVEVTVEGDTVDPKQPKEYSLIYKATDLSDNEASIKSTVKVLEPTCGANATWDGSDCVCNDGYQGNAWAGCTAIPAKKPVNTNNPTNQSQGTASSGKSQAQLDCEASWGTWKDNSWCDWESSTDNSSSSSESNSSSGSGIGSTDNGGSSSGSSQTCVIEPFKGGIYGTMDACKAAGESGKSGGLSWICYDAYDTCGNHLGYGLDW